LSHCVDRRCAGRHAVGLDNSNCVTSGIDDQSYALTVFPRGRASEGIDPLDRLGRRVQQPGWRAASAGDRRYDASDDRDKSQDGQQFEDGEATVHRLSLDLVGEV
jgi:hypothetical protein